MDLFMKSDEDLYQEINNTPQALVIRSKVPIIGPKGEEKEKEFCYVYADDPKFMLGKGSFGKVFVCFYYEGSCNQPDRLVKLALKIINIPQSQEQIKSIEHIVSTSRQEIQALLKLRQNKHIIRIEDIVQQDNTIYIMLEYCDDRDLVSFFTAIKSEKIITRESHVCFYFAQILDAFKQLNKLNFMHRDIKPSNILVKNRVLKVADFGMARQIIEGEENVFVEHVGTMITASPQIVSKLEYSSKCDIYSLGVILYWMVYGSFPFAKPPSEEDFKSDKLQFPKETEYFQVSPEMIKLLKQMLAYYQSQRIQWQALFEHPFFENPNPPFFKENSRFSNAVRETYGRNIITQFSDDESFLQTKIPASYYKFLKQFQGEQKYKKCLIEQRNSLKENPQLYSHKMIKDQYKNQDIRFKFYRTLLHELQNLSVDKILKNGKNELQFLRSLIIYSIQKFLIYMMTKVKDQLVFVIPPTIFKIQNLKLAENQGLHRNFVETVIEKVKGLEFTARLTAQEVGKLKMKCEEYKLTDLTGIFDELNEFNLQNFLAIIDQCIIETVYYLKTQIERMDQSKTKNEPVYRNLILLTHYLFMFSMQDEVFPKFYDPQFPYNTFLENEQFKTVRSFKVVTERVKSLLKMFE